MKATDTPKIDEAWWTKNKPVTLKSTGLGKAMKSYQESKAQAAKLAAKNPVDAEAGMQAYTGAEQAMGELDEAVKKAIAACNKVLHADCITVLNKLKKDVLPPEVRKLGAEKDGFVKDCKGEAARVKGAMEALVAATTKLSERVAGKMDEVGTLEDRLAEIRNAAAKASQKGATVDAKEVTEAQTVAKAIETASKLMADETQKMGSYVRKQVAEVFDDSLAAFEPSLARIKDKINFPLDVVTDKGLPQLEDAVARSRKALKAVQDLASGAADVQAEFLSLLESFNERGIRRDDAISGNLRSTGGMLDAADMDLMNHSESKGEPDPALLKSAAAKLSQGAKSLASIKTTIEAFRGSLGDFVKELPDFAKPSNKMFKPELDELGKLTKFTDDNTEELKKLTIKAQKAGAKLKVAMSGKQPVLN